MLVPIVPVGIFDTNSSFINYKRSNDVIVINRNITILVQMNLSSNLTGSAVFIVIGKLNYKFITNSLIMNSTGNTRIHIIPEPGDQIIRSCMNSEYSGLQVMNYHCRMTGIPLEPTNTWL